MASLKDKVIAVTGAGSGIGRALADFAATTLVILGRLMR
jgi:NADP-dependent 3-hydroxy acid dehydrogenase YdfG